MQAESAAWCSVWVKAALCQCSRLRPYHIQAQSFSMPEASRCSPGGSRHCGSGRTP
ncbi:hypothetical protein F2Q68_00003098 [Brassica cretica]|uniref:Uncharacterized protein n=1 Tax=Brassica cretica TaxID=69181 RepID=A0A8S9JIA1_BRACR|nr:hypothetical protein F2Q68_00003100 [Brassica cretica]KAF2581991.1 hypothetical protein F2Q68_00003098 [Brassica cretica]